MSTPPKPRRGRDYPPLAAAGLVMLLLLAVLPSALNLPQSNPAETLEYAPVPPEDDNRSDPPTGNLSSLGLASSAGPGSDATATGFDGLGTPEGRPVKAPSTKRCVGEPPRQTEDPMSPPCVAFFRGENGGTTYSGVTAEEVRVVVYLPAGTVYGGEGNTVGYQAEPGT